MHKVIVERERKGGRGPARNPPWEKRGRLEDYPQKEGIRRRAVLSRDLKSLNENLSPLKRYLRKQVGRPWNVVYREISTGLRPTSAVQQHVRDHVWDFVERDVTLGPKGQVYRAPHRHTWWSSSLAPGRLYIDPRTGILRVVKRRRS